MSTRPKAAKVAEKEVIADSPTSSRPWTASTTTTANNLEPDRTRLSAPQQASLSRSRSEAWRSRSQRRYSIENRNMASRRSSYAGRSQTRDVSPRDTTHSPSITSVSPSTTVCPTPKIRSPRPPPITTTSPQKTPQLSIRIPKSTDDLHADLHWQINAQNPANWGKLKKWMHTLIPSALALVFALGSSIVAPAHDTMVEKLQIPSTVAVLTLSLYVLGLVFGPYLSALGSEVFGRKVVYMICIPLYAIFMLASGLVRVLPGLLLCRFLAGVSCSPALHMGWATIGDLWGSGDKVLPLTMYVGSALLGSTLGPVLGAYLIYDENWRWTQYVVLCALGGCLLPVMFMQETSKNAILRIKNGESARAPIGRNELSIIFVKPLRILLEPIVLLYGLYAAFNFGVLYAVYTAFPAVLAQAEHFDRGHQGLSLLGMSVGVIMGMIIFALYDRLIHRPRVSRYKDSRATEEEQTLQTGQRTSRANRFSIASPSHEHIQMSQVGAPEGRRRSSILNTIRRLSTTGYKNLEASQIDPQRNVNLAVAAAKYINSIEANRDKHIMPERILILLNQNLEFAHLCVALEGYKLKFDRVELAKTLYDALQEHAALRSNSGPPTDSRSLYRSPSQHLKATEVTIEYSPQPPTRRPSGHFPLTTTIPSRPKTFQPSSNIPPPEWRLYPALPASVLIAGSLFMLGWTSHRGIHWIAPIVAMVLYAFSTLLVFLSTTMYVLECYGPVHGGSAIGGSMMVVFLFGFAFPLFAESMYRRLGPGLATSLFAFVAIVLGLVPSLLCVFGTALRRRQRFKEGK